MSDVCVPSDDVVREMHSALERRVYWYEARRYRVPEATRAAFDWCCARLGVDPNWGKW